MLVFGMSFELETRNDSRKSFYGKATVKREGNKLILQSYNTDVAQIENGKATVLDFIPIRLQGI
jgi:hypothetical protein